MQHKEIVLSRITERLEFILSIPNLWNKYPFPKNKNYNKSLNYLTEILDDKSEMWVILLSYAFLSPLGFLASEKNAYFQSESWYREFRFGKILMDLASQFGIPNSEKTLITQTLPLTIGLTGWHQEYNQLGMAHWLKDTIVQQEMQQYLNINRYQDILWFNQERFEILIKWLYILGFIEIGTKPKISANKFVEESINLFKEIKVLSELVKNSEYKIDKLLENLDKNNINS